MKIAIDFDSTICSKPTNYPQIGKPLDLAVETLKELISKKHTLILNTARAGLGLKIAKIYLERNDIKFSVPTGSDKIDADIFIDNKNLGMRLNSDGDCSWLFIRRELKKLGAL